MNKENNIQIQSIISNKFLIIDGDAKGVDIDIKPIKKMTIEEKKEQLSYLNNIEIYDIIQPKIYSINSIVKYLENCIIKIQLIPNYIRYSIRNKNTENINKATNIISELYNLYKTLEDHSNSIFAPIIEEYKNCFEIMFLNLKNSGIIFPIDFNLQINNNKQIHDFIIEPEKDNFTNN